MTAPETTAALERLKEAALTARSLSLSRLPLDFQKALATCADEFDFAALALASQPPTDGGWEEAFKAWATVQYGNPDTPALSGHGLAFRAGYLAAAPLPVRLDTFDSNAPVEDKRAGPDGVTSTRPAPNRDGHRRARHG